MSVRRGMARAARVTAILYAIISAGAVVAIFSSNFTQTEFSTDHEISRLGWTYSVTALSNEDASKAVDQYVRSHPEAQRPFPDIVGENPFNKFVSIDAPVLSRTAQTPGAAWSAAATAAMVAAVVYAVLWAAFRALGWIALGFMERQED